MADDWSARIIHGDCLAVMESLDADSIDAIVTDPPYGIRFMGEAWDGTDIDARAESLRAHQRERIERGTAARNDQFGGAPSAAGSYDVSLRGNRAFQLWTQEWAAAAFRILKPGGHLLSFASPRTYHRMTVGIEEAGFEIRDSIHWIFGSGFPKSLDVSKAIDKAAGAERTEGARAWSGGARSGGIIRDSEDEVTSTRTIYDAPATEEAAQWQGWGTGLKPAHEPVVLARKPLSGTVIATVLEHGTGAINIEKSRIGVEGGTRQVVAKAAASGREATSYGASIGSAPGGNEEAGGRWPANVLLSHLPECEGNGAGHTDVLCAPGCPVAELNEASGESSSAPSERNTDDSHTNTYGWAKGGIWKSGVHYGDDGGAARFFYIAKPRTRERVGGTIRNLHPTVKPIDLMRHLVRLITPPGGVVLDPFLGSGTTGCAAMVEGARFVGIERDDAHYATALARVSDYAFAQGRTRPLST